MVSCKTKGFSQKGLLFNRRWGITSLCKNRSEPDDIRAFLAMSNYTIVNQLQGGIGLYPFPRSNVTLVQVIDCALTESTVDAIF